MLGEHKKKVGKHVLSVQLMIYKLLPTSQVSHHAGEMVQNCGLLLPVIALFIKWTWRVA